MKKYTFALLQPKKKQYAMSLICIHGKLQFCIKVLYKHNYVTNFSRLPLERTPSMTIIGLLESGMSGQQCLTEGIK